MKGYGEGARQMRFASSPRVACNASSALWDARGGSLTAKRNQSRWYRRFIQKSVLASGFPTMGRFFSFRKRNQAKQQEGRTQNGGKISHGQRGHRSGRAGRGRGLCFGLSGHALDRGAGDGGQVQRRLGLRGMVGQRKVRHGGGGRRGLCRRAGDGHHEAGGPERGLGPADEPGLRGRSGRHGGAGGGRSRPHLLADGAGHAHVRHVLQAAGL